MRARVLLGYHARTGEPIGLDDAARRLHMFVPGRSGMGKSSLLEFLIRQDIRNGRAVIVIDPHGAMYRNILEYLVRRPSLLARTYLFDINETEHLVGVNYFDLKGVSEDKKLDLIMEGWARVFRETDEVLKTIQRWGPNAIQPLARYPVPLTVVELYRFLVNPSFRAAVLARVDDRYILDDWEAFRRLREHEQEAVLTALLNRTKKFVRTPHTRALTGQPNTIDWETVFRERAVVLINLHPEREGSETLAQMFGIIFIHQIMSAANLRPKEEADRHPVYLYVDEFARLVSTDFRFMLKELRKFGVSLVLAQQDLKDLDIDEGQLFETVRNDCGIKACFGMLASDSARAIAEDMFLPQVTGLRIKYQHTKPVAWPISKAAWVTSQSSSDSHANGSGSGISAHSSAQMNGAVLTSEGITISDMSQHGSGSGTVTALQRWTEFEERMIEEAPQFWTIEEELTQFTAAIMRQGVGELQLFYDEKKPPIPLRTPKPGSDVFVAVHARPEAVRAFQEAVYARVGARSAAEIESLIENRQREILAAPESLRWLPGTGDVPIPDPTPPEHQPRALLPEEGAALPLRGSRKPLEQRSRSSTTRKSSRGRKGPQGPSIP